jgi:hypothetical protein
MDSDRGSPVPRPVAEKRLVEDAATPARFSRRVWDMKPLFMSSAEEVREEAGVHVPDGAFSTDRGGRLDRDPVGVLLREERGTLLDPPVPAFLFATCAPGNATVTSPACFLLDLDGHELHVPFPTSAR